MWIPRPLKGDPLQLKLNNMGEYFGAQLLYITRVSSFAQLCFLFNLIVTFFSRRSLAKPRVKPLGL